MSEHDSSATRERGSSGYPRGVSTGGYGHEPHRFPTSRYATDGRNGGLGVRRGLWRLRRRAGGRARTGSGQERADEEDDVADGDEEETNGGDTDDETEPIEDEEDDPYGDANDEDEDEND